MEERVKTRWVIRQVGTLAVLGFASSYEEAAKIAKEKAVKTEISFQAY